MTAKSVSFSIDTIGTTFTEKCMICKHRNIKPQVKLLTECSSCHKKICNDCINNVYNICIDCTNGIFDSDTDTSSEPEEAYDSENYTEC